MASLDPPVQIGILGAARVAEYAMIAPAREDPSANVLALAARDPLRARAYAQRHGIGRIHQNYAALMHDPEIELVYIATPPCVHAELALAAIGAGKNVLVEKPFAMNAAEAESVANAAKSAGVFVAEAMHSRHHPLFGRLSQLVAAGRLGELKHMSALFEAPIARNPEEFRWEAALGGGALMDLGVYPLSWLRGLLAEEPTVVRASSTLEGDVDASIEAELLFPSKVTATMHASMVAQRSVAELIVEGTRGSMTVTNPLAPQMGHLIRFSGLPETEPETVPGPSTFAAQLAAVCARVRHSLPFPLPERDFVHSMMAIDAVRRGAVSTS